MLFEDFKRDDKKGSLVFINEEKQKIGNKVLSFLLKKIGKNILTAKSIIGMSLPVFMFDSASNLERNATGFGYAPLYFERAALTSDPV